MNHHAIPAAALAALTLILAGCAPEPPKPTVQTIAYEKPVAAGVTVAVPAVPAASSERRALSAEVPGGLQPAQAPQFVVLGFDDNSIPENVDWAVAELGARKNRDGSPVTASFYMIGGSGVAMFPWKKAYDAGHEVGNHTFNHPHGRGDNGASTLSTNGWRAELQMTFIALERLEIPRAAVTGYRQPYLEHSPHSLAAAVLEGFKYDCSIEVGFEPDQNGTNLPWPYTLDAENLPGFWELPVYALMVPQLGDAARYGLVDEGGKPYDLYAKLQVRDPGLTQPKITGFDYNLWTLYGLTGPEFTAILKYNLDQRLAGNRAPLAFGTHTDEYSAGPATGFRRQALLDFVDYALAQPGVRVVRADKVLDWVKKPQPLVNP